MGEDAQLTLDTIFGWVPAALAFIATVAVAVIGYHSARNRARDDRINPAYTDLLEEVKGYRAEAKEDREQVEKVEKALDDERGLRRELESKVRDQDGQLQTIRRELDQERSEREKLQQRVDWFKVTVTDAEDWIKRTVRQIRADYPQAWPALLPLPSWMTDPGHPRTATIPTPPDDGQPSDTSNTYTNPPGGHP